MNHFPAFPPRTRPVKERVQLRQFFLARLSLLSNHYSLKPVLHFPQLEKKSSGSDKLEESFCKLCDVAFTSDVQAKQHYAGRNHQRRLRGEPPLPKGFYNPVTGKWQRQYVIVSLD